MHRFPQIWNVLLLESRNCICWRTLTFFFVVREVLQFDGGKVRRNVKQQHVWPVALTTSQRIHQLRMQGIQYFLKIACIFFEISQTFKCLDLHCPRQKTVIQSDKGLSKIAKGASPRRHAETSPVKVKQRLVWDRFTAAEVFHQHANTNVPVEWKIIYLSNNHNAYNQVTQITYFIFKLGHAGCIFLFVTQTNLL